MAQYIPKDTLVAEIERLKADALQKISQCKRSGLERIMHQIGAYNKILSFINTLEVKEVDLEKIISFQWSKFCLNGKDKDSFVKVVKHFFELGMTVSNKEQKGE